MFNMWVYVGPEWLQEERRPQLRAGERLTEVWVRADSWTIAPATDEPDQVLLDAPPDPQGSSWSPSRITGTLSRVIEPYAAGILQIGETALLLEPRWPAVAPRWKLRSKRHTRPPRLPAEGSRITTQCTLSLLPDWGADLPADAPPTTRDWRIRQTRIEWRSRVSGESGELLRTSNVEEADWAAFDGDPYGVHLIDIDADQ